MQSGAVTALTPGSRRSAKICHTPYWQYNLSWHILLGPGDMTILEEEDDDALPEPLVPVEDRSSSPESTRSEVI